MDTQTIDQKVKEIKQSFRQMMDGATAQSMRQKGLDYHLNWGATIPRLREMADEIVHSSQCIVHSSQAIVHSSQCIVHSSDSALCTINYELAIALWKENIRECKILATMIMPPKEMLPEVADIWMEQTPTLEIAEQAAFNLYQHLPYAADKAFEWLASHNDLPQVCGYHILSRLFMRGQEPNERGINEFLDQAIAALQGNSAAVRKAAMQSVIRFSELSLVHERLAKSAIRQTGLDFL
ncbi:MAG: DNA alkylation repair protein [Prevotella sp.]|nr:DNA alkylation repair protein [Prevotella sp.]